MKKILYYGLGCLNMGGIEVFLFNLAKHIDKTKFQLNFLIFGNETPCFYDELTSIGCKFFHVTSRRKNWAKNIKEIRVLFKKERFDILHFNCASLSYLSLIFIGLKNKCEVIVHAHNNDLISGIITRTAHKINSLRLPENKITKFACSKSAGKFMFKNFDVNSNAKIIPNAIDAEKFIYDIELRGRIRQELNMEDKFVIGHVGRFAAEKNHSFLIDILKEICEKNNDVILLLVGGGELRDKVEKKAESLGVKDNIIFMGVSSEIPALLCAMDVFLFPSLFEGLGIVLIEAQANGLHCIASADVVPLEAQITNLLEYVPLSKSASYWADKIILYADGYYRENMVKEIKNAGFDIKEMVQMLEDLYLTG